MAKKKAAKKKPASKPKNELNELCDKMLAAMKAEAGNVLDRNMTEIFRSFREAYGKHPGGKKKFSFPLPVGITITEGKTAGDWKVSAKVECKVTHKDRTLGTTVSAQPDLGLDV